MTLGKIDDLNREDLESLCETMHEVSESGYDAWAKSEHALHVLVEEGVVTREQVGAARERGGANHESGMGLFGYEKMYDGPARPLTEEEAKFVTLL